MIERRRRNDDGDDSNYDKYRDRSGNEQTDTAADGDTDTCNDHLEHEAGRGKGGGEHNRNDDAEHAHGTHRKATWVSSGTDR